MKKNNLSQVFLNVCVFVLGLCLIIWADKVTNLVSRLLGCLAIIYSVIAFINYFKSKERTFHDTLSFVYGIIVLVIGLVLVFRVDFLKELVSFIIGIYIVLSGILKLQEVLAIQKNVVNKSVTAIVLSVVQILIGILCIVGKFLIPDAIVKFIGIMLIIYSVINVIDLIIVRESK